MNVIGEQPSNRGVLGLRSQRKDEDISCDLAVAHEGVSQNYVNLAKLLGKQPNIREFG